MCFDAISRGVIFTRNIFRFERTFGGIIGSALFLIFPHQVASPLFERVANLFPTQPGVSDFMLNVFEPTLVQAYKDKQVHASFHARKRLFSKGLGVILKLASSGAVHFDLKHIRCLT
jgi:hypothetical protein